MQCPSLSPTVLRRFHLTMMAIWALLLVPTLLVWRNSLTWIVTMSLYANFVGHFSSWGAARSEETE